MLKKLLIANRGEIAIRIAQAAAELGIATVGLHSEDDATSLHVRRVDEALALKGKGSAAYLDIASVIAAAKKAGCDAVHPGYGFLSENADFALACAAAKITFVGPTPEQLEAVRRQGARPRPGAEMQGAGAARHRCRRPCRRHGLLQEARKVGHCAKSHRRRRRARHAPDHAVRARSPTPSRAPSAEAKSAFGNGDLYAERLVGRARHIEVQIVGDGKGGIVALGERECTLQRRSQKIVEAGAQPQPRAGAAQEDRRCGGRRWPSP